MVKTNDLKKGTPIRLRNGWNAVIMDNMRGNTRMAEVDGFHKEIGSVYSHDIVMAQIDGSWVKVEHTPAQINLMAKVSLFSKVF